jgi:hypothetical protein
MNTDNQKKRTSLDDGIEALCQIVAREAVDKVVEAIGRLRGMPLTNSWELELDLEHRVLEQFSGFLQRDLDILRLVMTDFGLHFHVAPEIENWSLALLSDVFDWECRCGQTIEATAGDVLDGTVISCEDCKARHDAKTS